MYLAVQILNTRCIILRHAFALAIAPVMTTPVNAVQGTTPPVQVALDLYNILSESGTNLRQPVALETQLLQEHRMDSDVGRSMLQLLQVCKTEQ